MFGLYDPDGILRFMGSDKEACMAYAELFDLPSQSCSLMPLPEPLADGDDSSKDTRIRRKGFLAANSN